MALIRKAVRPAQKGIYFLARWGWKGIVILAWRFPSFAWGRWVVLGGYGVLMGWCLVQAELVDLQPYLVYTLLWLYAARWRWNYHKAMRGVRPVFERRDDV